MTTRRQMLDLRKFLASIWLAKIWVIMRFMPYSLFDEASDETIDDGVLAYWDRIERATYMSRMTALNDLLEQADGIIGSGIIASQDRDMWVNILLDFIGKEVYYRYRVNQSQSVLM